MRAKGRHMVFIGGTSEPGGLHVQTADIAAACAAAGVRTSILCTSVDHFSSLVDGRGIGLSVLPKPATGAAWGSMAVRSRLAQLQATDAVLCNGQFGAASAAQLVAVSSVCGAVYTIDHSPTERGFLTRASRQVRGLALRKLVRRSIVVSEEIGRQARADFGIAPDRVVVCRNWYDPAFQRPTVAARRAARSALGLPADGTVVGFHGRLAPDKRVDVLLNAYALLDVETRAKTPLLLVGDGWKKRALRNLAQNLGIGGTVVFAGWKPEVVDAVSAIDVFVLPSLLEGFPLSLMEAMACGAYCIAHPMSPTIELLGGDGLRGVLWPLDTPALMAGALEAALYLHENERRATGARAADWIRANHSRQARLRSVMQALDVAEAAVPGVRRRLEFAAR